MPKPIKKRLAPNVEKPNRRKNPMAFGLLVREYTNDNLWVNVWVLLRDGPATAQVIFGGAARKEVAEDLAMQFEERGFFVEREVRRGIRG